MAAHSTAVAKRLLDSMQNDLRTLSAESKRKHPEVKEVSGILDTQKCKQISTSNVSLKRSLQQCGCSILNFNYPICNRNIVIFLISDFYIMNRTTFMVFNNPKF